MKGYDYALALARVLEGFVGGFTAGGILGSMGLPTNIQMKAALMGGVAGAVAAFRLDLKLFIASRSTVARVEIDARISPS